MIHQVRRTRAQLATSPRTLQRRLAEHGVSYARLLDDTRAGVAKRYLSDRHLSLAEVAFMVGFAEQSSFNHAFKRWTGQAPKEYWRGNRVGEASPIVGPGQLDQAPS